MSIRQNSFYNLAGSIIPLVTSLITIPIYIGLIGEERFGILAIVWLLVGYFGLFDLGLGRATAQGIAALRDARDFERAEVFWTALTMNIGLAIVAGLTIWPVSEYFFENIFKIEAVFRQEILSALPWLILAISLAIVSGTLLGALQGRERFLELNIISVFGTLMVQLLPLVVASFLSIDLSFLLPAVLFSRFLVMLALFERCKRHVIHSFKPSFKRKQARKLLRFGGWVTVSSLVGPLMVILDRFIIGAMMGAKAVTYYTVPFQLAERSTIIPNALSSALFPRFSAMTINEEKALANNAMNILAVVMTPLMVSGILLINPFLTWWLDAAFANEATLIGQVMLIGFWVNSFARVPFAQLQARNRPNLVATCHLFELLPYFVLLFIGLEHLGLEGAAIAFALRVFIDFLLLSGFAGSLRQSLRLLIMPIFLIAMSLMVAILLNKPADIESLTYISLYIVITINWAYWKAPDSIKKNMLNKVTTAFNKQ